MEADGHKPEIQILNHEQGETICYPLVLLEGIIARQDISAAGDRRLLQTSSDPDSERAGKLQLLDSSAENTFGDDQGKSTLLVKCRNHEMAWPVIKKGFKAVVPLNIGENLIVLKAMDNEHTNVLEFILTYTPLQISRFVRVVYVKCADSDGSFDAPLDVSCDEDCAVKKLSFNSRLLQTFTAESLHQHGLGHKTFRIEEDESGSPKVHVFTSKLTSAEALGMTGDQLYDTFSKELKCSNLHDRLCKLWTFMSCTHYDPPPPDQFDEKLIKKYVKAHTALGGGFFALFGTGGLHTWASSIEELVPCFTDTRLINKMELFDDSNGRGTYWANYATGLGASMHELGHCFDLAHTPKGIMSRGFDHMNSVWTMWRRPPSLQRDLSGPAEPEEKPANKTAAAVPGSTTGCPATEGLASTSVSCVTSTSVSLSCEKSSLAAPNEWSHGAHWYRSSAVILSYHKWLSSSNLKDDKPAIDKPMIHWCRTVCGPVGNAGDSHQKGQQSFNSVKWLESQGAVLGGFIIHAGKYVRCIQFIGNQEKPESGDCQKVLSEPHGTDNVAKRYTFTISSPDEYVTAIDVRAGAWIDAIRLHTNQKSSVWMGGMGGDEYHLTPPPGRNILGVMGTSGKFVGSLGVLLNSDPNKVATESDVDDKLLVYAPHGIRLIELWNKEHSEVYKHWEFLQHNPPTTFPLCRAEVKDNASTLLVEDDKGYICRTGFVYDYSDII